MDAIQNAKSFKKGLLKGNVNAFLSENFDWKVSKAVATGQELSDADKQFRASIVAEYNNRVTALNDATTIEQINSVKLNF